MRKTRQVPVRSSTGPIVTLLVAEPRPVQTLEMVKVLRTLTSGSICSVLAGGDEWGAGTFAADMVRLSLPPVGTGECRLWEDLKKSPARCAQAVTFSAKNGSTARACYSHTEAPRTAPIPTSTYLHPIPSRVLV